MAATPKTGQVKFVGKSGATYTYNLYNSDVANAFCTFSTTGAAGTSSPTYIVAPEDMTLVDVSVVTGIVDTTSLVLWVDGVPIPAKMLLWANCVNTLPFRTLPQVGVRQGRQVQFAEV